LEEFRASTTFQFLASPGAEPDIFIWDGDTMGASFAATGTVNGPYRILKNIISAVKKII